VYEDPGTSPHLNYETDYSYDALNNLLSATQKGGAASGSWRVRSFAYDGLSRLTSETNPESGTVSYSYNSSGDLASKNSPAPNQSGTATVTTTYTYDALHRLTGTNYSDGTTPANYYYYDVAPSWNPYATNVAGRVSNSKNQYGGGTSEMATATAYCYDKMGRVTEQWQQTPSLSPGGEPVFSNFDMVGNLISTTDAAGTVISYGHDGASRITTITSSLNDANHPPTLWTADPTQGYYPEGDLEKATLGNGLTESRVYTPRLSLPPCRINLNTSGGIPTGCSGALPTGIVQSYQLYYGPWGSAVNGNIDAWGGSGVQNFNRGYGYDSLNRLATMSDVAPQPCQGLTWTIDAWGNMIAQTTTAGTCNNFSSSVNTKNQLQSGYQYDAAGNVTYDGVHNYTYDAENRVIQVDSGSTATYVYNENGQRVRKSTAPGAFTEFFYGPNGLVQSVYNGSGWPAEYVFAGSHLITDYTNGTTDFVLTDHLGSTRLMTGVNQAVLSNMDYMPFGQQIAGGSATTDKFTGQEYDSESGLYQFPFRYYESPMARFMTPDPAGLAAADPTNPQSWNRYAYVMNSPASLVDLLGLNPGGGAGTGGCQGYACGSQNYCGGGSFTGGGASPCYSSDCNLTIDGGASAPCSLLAGLLGTPDSMEVQPCGQVYCYSPLGLVELHGWTGEYTWYECILNCSSLPVTNSAANNGPLDWVIEDYSLLRLKQTWWKWGLGYGAKVGVVNLFNIPAKTVVALSGLTTLMIVGATMIDATSPGMPLAPGPPAPPDPCMGNFMGLNWVPGPNGTTVGVPACQ
jgi:RHS repeat-associated protein